MFLEQVVDIKLQSALLIFAGVVNLIFGIVVYSKDPSKKGNVLFGLFAISVSLWAFSRAMFEEVGSVELIYLSSVLLYLSASFIPLFFLMLSFALFTEKIILSKVKLFLIVSVYSLIVLLTLIPGVVIKSVDFIVDTGKEIVFGPGYLLYLLYIVGYFTAGFIVLFKKYLNYTGLLKTQLKYVFIGILIPSLIGITTNLILPTFGFFQLFWLGPITTILMVIVVGYAITRYRLWNFKIIIAEVLVSIILLVLFLNIFLSRFFVEYLFKSTIFILVSVFGMIIIRGVKKEIKARERVEKLAKEIMNANDRLRKMEKQKTEFVSIASHQLRTPLTAIKGYASMLIEGSFGKLPKKALDAVEKIFKSSQVLVVIIEDFLMVSRIEQGRVQYEFDIVELRDVVKEVINDVESDAEEKQIKIKLNVEGGRIFSARADRAKIKQVVHNIVSNAIKYTENGFVKILLSKNKENKKIRIAVSDTGVGISKEMKSKLFKKFSKGEDSKLGSGIGLYVAKEIVKAHKGKIWAQSDGVGSGATFFIELPEVKRTK